MPRKIRPIRIEGDVAYVPLTQGYEAIIDAADAHLVDGVCWTTLVQRRRDQSVVKVYAMRFVREPDGAKAVYLHRVIAGTPEGMETEHRNGDGLDNRRDNLRHATHMENMRNRRNAINNRSGKKGVSWSTSAGKWRAQIRAGDSPRHLGYFECIEDAAAAYAEASARLHGEFGRAE